MRNNIQLPERVDLARCPTPFQLLTRASKRWGAGRRIWVKRDDLTGTTLTGNKVRKLEFFAAYAKARGIDTLITCGGLQSNHARATAAVCAQLGWHCELVLRGKTAEPSGNTLLDKLFGADIQVVEAPHYQRHLAELLEQTAERHRLLGRNPLIIPTGGSNGIGIWGYIAAARELLTDFSHQGITDAAVVTATGSGGTQAGLTLGMDMASANIDVIGIAVSDDSTWFNKKVIDDIEEARKQWPDLPALRRNPITIDDFVGPGYGRAGTEIYALIAELAALEGVVLDPVYTGKAFYGMLELIKNNQIGAHQDIVFVHTGGIFGLFPHHQQLAGLLEF